MSNRTICLINDSFPPVTDGVANAVVNYGRAITESGDKAVVVTPACGLSVFREDHADTYGIPV